MKSLSKLRASRDLVANLVAKEIRVRYMGAFFGFAWSLGNPLVVTLTYFVVFTYIFPSTEDRFALHLVTGILHWMLIAQTLPQSCDWLIGNSSLIRKIRFPRILLPLSGGLTICCFWFAAFAVYAVFFVALGGRASIAFAAYPLLFASYVCFIAGLGLTFSVGQVLFRDLKHIVDVMLPLLFWVTPIVWTHGALPEEAANMLAFNPLSVFFEGFSSILHQGRWPDASVLLVAALLGISSLVVGLLIFRTADNVVERL